MSIKKNLNTVINSISEFSRQTNMVAINASIYASRLSGSEGAPFQVLAKEIQEMSKQSIDKLGELDNLMNEIAALSVLINTTGRLRMTLMRLVISCSLEDQVQMKDVISFFENGIKKVEESSINTLESRHKINQIKEEWNAIISNIDCDHTDELYISCNQLVERINELLKTYEDYSG